MDEGFSSSETGGTCPARNARRFTLRRRLNRAARQGQITPLLHHTACFLLQGDPEDPRCLALADAVIASTSKPVVIIPVGGTLLTADRGYMRRAGWVRWQEIADMDELEMAQLGWWRASWMI